MQKNKNCLRGIHVMHGIEDDYVAITNGELVAANYQKRLYFYQSFWSKTRKRWCSKTMGYQHYLNQLKIHHSVMQFLHT